MSAVLLEGVTKRYGRLVALDRLSFEVPRGVVSALIGPNGSGKTTTFGVLAGLLRPDAGRVSLFGEGPFDPRRHSGRIGLMPQDSAPSPHASVRDSLRFYAALAGASAAEARREADRCLEAVRLTDRARARTSQLSHGMRRRFSVAQALLNRPELVLLDEPTSGLDPELAKEMRELIGGLRGQATVIVSSHVLSELETLCDHAVILNAGRAVKHGSMQAVTRADTRVRVTVTGTPDLEALRARIGEVSLSFRAPELSVQSDHGEGVTTLNARLLPALLEQGLGIVEVQAGDSLEAAYLAARAP